ncbi:GNAT family N-acetyltransferase [Aliikangiella sp. IMCC44359]|uniref:GNAT family N-acetyltransferase n=1 Tax=Aliikangiella sp. IMCC44359 TaxID=3459125 RepID=UPI00403AFAC0
MAGQFNHPQLANTERLILRPVTENDAEAVYLYRNQPEVSLFQGWTPESTNEVVEYVKGMQARKAADAGHWYQVALQLKEQKNIVIGDVAFCIDVETQQQAELGIALDTQYQKKGYAVEAINALIHYLFAKHQLHRIHVSIDPRNQASQQLFKRVGFRFEGHLKKSVLFKGEWCDDVVMAILRSEYKNA